MPEIVIGNDAPRLYQALAVRSGLKALQKGFQVNRAYTAVNCLRTATLFTGNTYKPRTKTELQRAVDDLTKVIDAARPDQAEGVRE